MSSQSTSSVGLGCDIETCIEVASHSVAHPGRDEETTKLCSNHTEEALAQYDDAEERGQL